MSKQISQLQTIYNRMKTLKSFSSNDFLDITSDKHRIGACFYLFNKRGIIVPIERGVYTLKDTKNIKKYSKNSVKSSNNDKYALLYGLELEMEYNSRKIGLIEKASYHSERAKSFNKYFIAESDGSLHPTTFPSGECVELVSVPMNSNDVLKSIKSLKDTFTLLNNGQEIELSDVISFNNHTGAHLHISLNVKNKKTTTIEFKDNKTVKIKGKSMNPKSFTDRKFLKKIALNVKKQIKLQMPEFYDNFILNYYRRYAKQMRANSRERYQEFNLLNDNTIEYRSLHLRGIKTWSQLELFYKIVTTTINKLYDDEFNKDKPFNNVVESVLEIESVDDTKNIIDSINLDKDKVKKIEV